MDCTSHKIYQIKSLTNIKDFILYNVVWAMNVSGMLYRVWCEDETIQPHGKCVQQQVGIWADRVHRRVLPCLKTLPKHQVVGLKHWITSYNASIQEHTVKSFNFVGTKFCGSMAIDIFMDFQLKKYTFNFWQMRKWGLTLKLFHFILNTV